MKANELNELMKIKTPNQILQKYILGEISLTLAQIDKVNKLKDGTAEENHGGCNMKGDKYDKTR